MTKKGATGDFFFHFRHKKKMTIFSYQKKKCVKKMNLRLPDWPQLRPPAEQETYSFFCGQPHVVVFSVLNVVS